MTLPATPTASKRYYQGTHRTRPPEETWAAIAPVLERVGITRVADVTSLDSLGIPVYQVVRPASRNLSVSQGKAVTHAAARVSGTMEAIELWHAEDLEHLVQVTLPLREMQYANPLAVETFKWRPDSRLLDAVPMAWLEATSLTRNRLGWLPRQMLELDFTVPRTLRPQPFHLTSNGLASGNCREEALVHSLCELIERHGLYLAHSGGRPRVPLDLESIEADYCLDLIRRIRGAGMRCAAHDLTWEVGVPTIVVDLVARDLPNVWRGAGCHPDPSVALSRALTEAAQSRLTYISGARDDLTQFSEHQDPAGAFTGFVVPVPERRMEEITNLASGDVETDLGRLLDRLHLLDYEPFMVDLTRDEIGVPVVMAWIAGLREAPYG